MNNIIWQGQKRQMDFMARGEYEALYGGAAGGGKSEALVIEALRQIHLPHYRAVLIRKTYPKLEELISKSLRYYKSVSPGAKYNATHHVWKFPSGAKIYFRSMPNKTSYQNFQGLSYEFIGFDELTEFTEKEYMYLMSRNRANGKGSRVYIRATANPGGIGHAWVKARFIDAGAPEKTIIEKNIITDPDGNSIETVRDRVFIPSTVFDNKILLDNNREYLDSLSMLPEAEKKAFLYGDWNSFTGQVFTEWRDRPENYLSGINTHVIEPFVIPKHWRRYRAYDFGYSKPYAVLWFAVDEDGRAYLYRELYGSSGANAGVKEEASVQAKRVREIENELEGGNYIYGVADPAIWDESYGKSNAIVRMFEKEGVYFEKADNKRLSGKMRVHQRLAFDSEGRPGLYVFKNCCQTIRTLPSLVYSQINVEDVDTECEDHIYDALRYFVMLLPQPAFAPKKEVIKHWTPLGEF